MIPCGSPVGAAAFGGGLIGFDDTTTDLSAKFLAGGQTDHW